MNAIMLQRIRERLIDSIKHHLGGWLAKVANDFSEKSCSAELKALGNDSIYNDFGFATIQYVAIRKIGRMSISIGRRLGEIYDKIPRFVAAARFSLSEEQVKEVFNKLELDIAIRKKYLSKEDVQHVESVGKKYFKNVALEKMAGVGIEIRYNFNPNDSSRLRKDVEMCKLLIQNNLHPVYLVFSSISPREDAIKRLSTAGWSFLTGDQAIDFLKDLLEVDFQNILLDDLVQKEINGTIRTFMSGIFHSKLVMDATKIP